jgi:succinoglycan biosynthesis transport protein ExoP
MAENMEDEIDLRQYVAVLFKYWYWIIGLAIVATLVAFAVSSFLAPVYQATALVTATQPRYQLQFDSRFQNIPGSNIQTLLQNQYRTYPTLATSDDVLQRVADQTGWSPVRLRNAAQATGGSDPSLLMLAVKGENAQEVTGVANAWAEIFVETINRIYGSGGDLEYFKQQQEGVAQSLVEADAALTAFRKENGFGFSSSSASSNSGGSGSDNVVISTELNPIDQFGLIGQRLKVNNSLLTDYEAKLVRLRQMQHEVELLSTSVTTETSPVLVAGLLSEMVNSGIVKEAQAFQIKLDEVDPAAGLAAMKQALAAQVTAIETETTTLKTKIAALQEELAAKQSELEQLNRQRAVLSRKVQELELNISNSGQVKVASPAAVPTAPVSPRRAYNAAIAGVLGLIVGIFGAFALEWWRAGK